MEIDLFDSDDAWTLAELDRLRNREKIKQSQTMRNKQKKQERHQHVAETRKHREEKNNGNTQNVLEKHC